MLKLSFLVKVKTLENLWKKIISQELEQKPEFEEKLFMANNELSGTLENRKKKINENIKKFYSKIFSKHLLPVIEQGKRTKNKYLITIYDESKYHSYSDFIHKNNFLPLIIDILGQEPFEDSSTLYPISVSTIYKINSCLDLIQTFVFLCFLCYDIEEIQNFVQDPPKVPINKLIDDIDKKLYLCDIGDMIQLLKTTYKKEYMETITAEEETDEIMLRIPIMEFYVPGLKIKDRFYSFGDDIAEDIMNKILANMKINL